MSSDDRDTRRRSVPTNRVERRRRTAASDGVSQRRRLLHVHERHTPSEFPVGMVIPPRAKYRPKMVPLAPFS
jgi:hypothetical protein